MADAVDVPAVGLRAPRRSSDVVERTVAGETFLLPVRGEIVHTAEMFVLSEVARFLWERLDGTRDIPRLAADVAEAFRIGTETAEADTRAFLEVLRGHRLLLDEGP